MNDKVIKVISDDELMIFYPELSDEEMQVYKSMAQWWGQYTRSMRELGDSLKKLSNHMNGLVADIQWVDETAIFNGPLGLWPKRKYRVPVAPTTDIFRRTTKPIELVPPVAADLSVPVRGSVHIPEDVDLSGRVVPEVTMPDPGPIVIPSGGWQPTTITKQRRS